MIQIKQLQTIAFPVFIFGLLLQANHYLSAENAWGFLPLVLAGCLWLWIMPPLPRVDWWSAPLQLPLAAGRRRLAAFALVGIGVLLLCRSAWIFLHTEGYDPEFWWYMVNTGAAVWNIYAVGFVLCMVGLWLLLAPTPAPPQPHNWLALGAVILLALGLRLYQLDEKPWGLWFDEADNGVVARRMLNKPEYRPALTSQSNTTLPHLWLYGLSMTFFGQSNPLALRLVSALFGVGGVVMAYFAGYELRGASFGLLMALVLALARWGLNFSRIAMTGIDAPFFLLLMAYFLIRFAKYGGGRAAFWLALSLGVSLWFYQALRLPALLVMALFSLLWWRRGAWWAGFGLSLLLAGVLLICYFPWLIFEYHNPRALTARAEQVSIFRHEELRGEMSIGEAYVDNLRGYAGMFHLRGDENGRHNFLFHPQFDPLSGLLLVVGLMIALRNWPAPEVWLFGGVSLLSILVASSTFVYETPNSLRVILILVSGSYAIALALWSLGTWRYARPLVILALLLIFQQNVPIFFGDWYRVPETTYGYSFAQAYIGRVMARKPDRLLYTPGHLRQREIDFLWRESDQNSRMMELPNALPLVIQPSYALIWLQPHEAHLIPEIQSMYPRAEVVTVYPSDLGLINDDWTPELLHYVELEPYDIVQTQGLDPFGNGLLYIPEYAAYLFDGDADVWLDGQLLEYFQVLHLARGFHSIRVKNGDLPIWKPAGQLDWSPIPKHYIYKPSLGRGSLLGRVFPESQSWHGTAFYLQLYSMLAAPTMADHRPPYAVEWTGSLRVPMTGWYVFFFETSEYIEFWLDHELVFLSPTGNTEVRLYLEKGLLPLRIRYRDAGEVQHFSLWWQPPYLDHQVYVPSWVFRPY